jgi:hypothetical protein
METALKLYKKHIVSANGYAHEDRIVWEPQDKSLIVV